MAYCKYVEERVLVVNEAALSKSKSSKAAYRFIDSSIPAFLG